MIFGHLGLALGGRAVDAEIPLPWLMAAALAPDIIDFGIAATGKCNPGGAYTHGLAPVVGTALILGAIEGWRSRRVRAALVIAALVLSHVLADYVTGLKALWVGGPIIGLDLYRWGWGDFALEAVVITVGWWAARRWGRLPRWTVSWVVLGALLGAQLLADVIPDRSTVVPTQAECSKASIVQDLPGML